MVVKKKKKFNINNVDVYKLDYTKLIQYTKAVYEELQKERESRTLLQGDRDQLNVFWMITRDDLTKLMFDVCDMHKEAEQKEIQIIDLKKRLRQQRVQLRYENANDLNKLRLENQVAIRALAIEYKKQTDDLYKLNSSIQSIIENKDFQQRNQLKDIQINYVNQLNNTNSRLENQMNQVLVRMEEQRKMIVDEVQTKHVSELNKCQDKHEKHLKTIVEMYNNEIEELMAFHRNSSEETLSTIIQIKDELQAVIKENLKINNSVLDFTEKNNKLLDNLLDLQNTNQYLEQQLLNYDNCKQKAGDYKKEIKKYKCLLKLKYLENVVLENDNAKMKQSFEKYDDYFARAFVDLQYKIINKNI